MRFAFYSVHNCCYSFKKLVYSLNKHFPTCYCRPRPYRQPSWVLMTALGQGDHNNLIVQLLHASHRCVSLIPQVLMGPILQMCRLRFKVTQAARGHPVPLLERETKTRQTTGSAAKPWLCGGGKESSFTPSWTFPVVTSDFCFHSIFLVF